MPLSIHRARNANVRPKAELTIKESAKGATFKKRQEERRWRKIVFSVISQKNVDLNKTFSNK